MFPPPGSYVHIGDDAVVGPGLSLKLYKVGLVSLFRFLQSVDFVLQLPSFLALRQVPAIEGRHTCGNGNGGAQNWGRTPSMIRHSLISV